MKEQFSNQIYDSFLYYLDHKLIKNGSGFLNKSELFYPINTQYSNYATYSAPFNQFIIDSSVSGPNLMSGVYLGNTFITKGASGLHEIDYLNGKVLFSGAVNDTVSGNYAIKEFNIKPATVPDSHILFEGNYLNRLKTDGFITGLNYDQVDYPAIYVRNEGVKNYPFAFGGENKTVSKIRCLVLSDNAFNLDAALSLMADLKDDYIGILNQNERPFNLYGGMVSGNSYNYTGIVANKIQNGESAYIDNVMTASFNSNAYSQEIKKMNPEVFSAIVDFEICKERFTKVD